MADDGNARFKAVVGLQDETAAGFAGIERAFERLGLTAAQVEKEIDALKEVDDNDRLAQNFKAAELELRRMGLTAEAVTEEMDRLRVAQAAIAEEARFDANDPWAQAMRPIAFAGFGGRGGGEGHGGGERHGEGGEHEGREGHEHSWLGVREHFGELGASVGEAGASLGEMLPMLGAFAAFGSAAGLVEMIHHTVEEQAALEAMSKQLGLAANQLEAFHYAANIADVPVDAMDRSLGKFGETMAQAASGQNKLAAEMFHKMGISIEDAHHHLVPMMTILPEVAQALKNTHDPQMRLYLAMTLFGRAGRDMLPLLIQGSQGFKDLTTQAEKLGPELTDVDRNHLEQFNESWKNAEYMSQSFMDRLSADLAPVMTPLLDKFTAWVAANKDWIGLKVADDVQGLSTALQSIPWAQVTSGFSSAAGVVDEVVQDTVGWKALLIGLAAIKLTGPFREVIEDLGHIIAGTRTLITLVGTDLPAAWRVAMAAEEAYDANFKGSLTGRLAATALATYDLASKETKVDLNPQQQKLLESFHLQAGQSPTDAEIKQLNALAAPGQDQVGALPKAASEWSGFKQIEHLLGLPDGLFGAAVPASPVPNAPLPQTPGYTQRDLPAARDSTVTVNVHFDNAPPNMSTVTTTTGDAGGYRVNVGQNLLAGGPN